LAAGPGNPDAADRAFGDNEAGELNTKNLPGMTNIDPESNKVEDITNRVR